MRNRTRELKFRLYDKQNFRMLHWEELKKGPMSTFEGNSDDYYFSNFMQYTGCEDKQGNKIYEGDIVCDDEPNGIFVVEWDGKRSRFQVRNLKDENSYNSVGGHAHCVEIIGNVYENPELLK